MSITSATTPATTTATARVTGARSADSRRASRALPVRAFARIAGVLFAALLGLGLAGLNSSANAETSPPVWSSTPPWNAGATTSISSEHHRPGLRQLRQALRVRPVHPGVDHRRRLGEADAYAGYHIPDISFEDGFYSVYMAYAQWTDNGWVYSGEYMDTYTQYYEDSSWESSSCYMGF